MVLSSATEHHRHDLHCVRHDHGARDPHIRCAMQPMNCKLHVTTKWAFDIGKESAPVPHQSSESTMPEHKDCHVSMYRVERHLQSQWNKLLVSFADVCKQQTSATGCRRRSGEVDILHCLFRPRMLAFQLHDFHSLTYPATQHLVLQTLQGFCPESSPKNSSHMSDVWFLVKARLWVGLA